MTLRGTSAEGKMFSIAGRNARAEPSTEWPSTFKDTASRTDTCERGSAPVNKCRSLSSEHSRQSCFLFVLTSEDLQTGNTLPVPWHSPAARYLCLGTRRQHVTCALALAGSTLPVPWHSPAARYLCLSTRRQHVTCALALAGSTLPVPWHSPAAVIQASILCCIQQSVRQYFKSF